MCSASKELMLSDTPTKKQKPKKKTTKTKQNNNIRLNWTKSRLTLYHTYTLLELFSMACKCSEVIGTSSRSFFS